MSGINDTRQLFLVSITKTFMLSIHDIIFMSGIHDTQFFCMIFKTHNIYAGGIHDMQYLCLVSMIHNIYVWYPLIYNIFFWYQLYIILMSGSPLLFVYCGSHPNKFFHVQLVWKWEHLSIRYCYVLKFVTTTCLGYMPNLIAICQKCDLHAVTYRQTYNPIRYIIFC